MDFLRYHIESSNIRDIDPANDCLLYICDRFELSMEQRYWLSFLYSTCYCAPTVYYIYNEFPDFENVNQNRLQRWWDKNKSKTVFQTDRLKIKTMNKFVETYCGYRELIGSNTQAEYFNSIACGDKIRNYISAYEQLGTIRNIGRFTLFIYLEMINVLTDYKCEPDKLEWKKADNCRKGLCYSMGLQDSENYGMLDDKLNEIIYTLKQLGCEHSNIFNVETTLCAYKKFKHEKRYIGYYIDRQLTEIKKMESMVTEGVAWRVMHEFRNETYKKYFYEFNILDNRFMRDGKDLGHEAAIKQPAWISEI